MVHRNWSDNYCNWLDTLLHVHTTTRALLANIQLPSLSRTHTHTHREKRENTQLTLQSLLLQTVPSCPCFLCLCPCSSSASWSPSSCASSFSSSSSPPLRTLTPTQSWRRRRRRRRKIPRLQQLSSFFLETGVKHRLTEVSCKGNNFEGAHKSSKSNSIVFEDIIPPFPPPVNVCTGHVYIINADMRMYAQSMLIYACTDMYVCVCQCVCACPQGMYIL